MGISGKSSVGRPSEDGIYLVKMKNGQVIPVEIQYKKELKIKRVVSMLGSVGYFPLQDDFFSGCYWLGPLRWERKNDP